MRVIDGKKYKVEEAWALIEPLLQTGPKTLGELCAATAGHPAYIQNALTSYTRVRHGRRVSCRKPEDRKQGIVWFLLSEEERKAKLEEQDGFSRLLPEAQTELTSMLGVLPDATLARQFGMSLAAVARRREELGIKRLVQEKNK